MLVKLCTDNELPVTFVRRCSVPFEESWYELTMNCLCYFCGMMLSADIKLVMFLSRDYVIS